MNEEKRFIDPSNVVVKQDKYTPIKEMKTVKKRKKGPIILFGIFGFVYLAAMFAFIKLDQNIDSQSPLVVTIEIISIVIYLTVILLFIFNKKRFSIHSENTLILQTLEPAYAGMSTCSFNDISSDVMKLGISDYANDVMFESDIVDGEYSSSEEEIDPSIEHNNTPYASPILLNDLMLGEAYAIDLEVETFFQEEEIEEVVVDEEYTTISVIDTYEDDEYADEIEDTLVKKSSNYESFGQLGYDIDNYMASKGIESHFGLKFIASLMFSRLMLLDTESDKETLSKAIFSICHCPEFIIDASLENGNIFSRGMLMTAFDYARDHSDQPIFIRIHSLKAKSAMDFVRPIFSYISNFNDDAYIASNHGDIKVPTNIYFLVTLENGESIFDLSRKFLTYTCILDFTFESASNKVKNAKPVNISLKGLRSYLQDVGEETLLTEDGFKKIDNIVSLLHDVNSYRLNNKIAIRLENYLSVLLSVDRDEEKALDEALSSSFFGAAIISRHPELLTTDHDIEHLIDTQFGRDGLRKCRTFIKRYTSMFDKEGNKIDA